ncbi:MAG: branched-chain amino acid ABC transporter permease [Deltaproteobacteria bacterium HGW-Deltaproteobacteria-12]|nr:MAG: branched-chain amino acid ABC transporter permease [Deltaproteobacteria bacterium HGW-Deltaproteobacteria-12]
MDPITTMYVTQGLHGLAYGMVLFLVASGLTLIFGMMGVLNMAHAAFFMLSAYFAYQITQTTGNFWVALLLAPIATGVLGMLVEKFLLRKVHAMGHVAELIMTTGVMFVILGAVKFFWGTEFLAVPAPKILDWSLNYGGLIYPVYRIFVMVLTSIILVLMALIIFKTRLGMVVRAAVSNSAMVNSLGINVPVLFMFVFGAGSLLAGIAGVVIAPYMSVNPHLAEQMGMDAFIVVVVGGFGSLGGAFMVAMIIGLLTAFGVQFLSNLAPILTFAFMAIVLAIRPMGFFGERE